MGKQSVGEIRRFATRSTQHIEIIKTKKQFIQRLEKYNYDILVCDKCNNIEVGQQENENQYVVVSL